MQNWLIKIASRFKVAELRGEWFLTDDGDSYYADGDVSDANHEMVAFQSKVPEELFESYENGTLTPEERFDIGEDFLQFMEKGGEAREWVVTHDGWTRVHGNNFETWKLDLHTLEIIVNFLGEEMQSMEEEEIGEEEISIDELSTGKYYNMSVQQLFNAQDTGTLSNFLMRFVPPTADASQEKVKRLEQEKQDQLMNEGMNLIQQAKANFGENIYKTKIAPMLANKPLDQQLVVLRQVLNNPNFAKQPV